MLYARVVWEVSDVLLRHAGPPECARLVGLAAAVLLVFCRTAHLAFLLPLLILLKQLPLQLDLQERMELLSLCSVVACKSSMMYVQANAVATARGPVVVAAERTLC